MKYFAFLLFVIIPISHIKSQVNDKAERILHTMRSNTGTVQIIEGENGESTAWGLAPEIKPDVYTAGLKDGKRTKITFKSDIDSISFDIEPGKAYDFVIDWNGKKCFQQIKAIKFVPAAKFSSEYQKSRKGKIFVSIPEFYEMVNIGIAISKFGKQENYMVYKKSNYYQEVINWFEKYSEHPFIKILDSVFEINYNYYHSYKMNGNAFYFDDNGEIKRSPVFDRTGFSDQNENKLLPYLDVMADFAKTSNFQKFYKENKKLYDQQIRVYTDSIGVGEMQKWLQKQFPGNSAYDTYNIIFSPLVYGNQSSTWFESNGFKELQPHVNFPYRQSLKSLLPISKTAEYIYRGNIVFTELNHGYINPEADKYAIEISNAISNRDVWVDLSKGSSYYGGNSLFNEYMNWVLINLRIIDYVPLNEQEKLIDHVVKIMVTNRGFLKFEEFNNYLITLYKNKEKKTTVADLYPQIIAWFDKNNI